MRTVSVFGVASGEAAAAAAAAGLPSTGATGRRWVSSAAPSEGGECEAGGECGSESTDHDDLVDVRGLPWEDDEHYVEEGDAAATAAAGRSASGDAVSAPGLGQRHNRVGGKEWVAGGSVLVGSRPVGGQGRRRGRDPDDSLSREWRPTHNDDDDDDDDDEAGRGAAGGAASVWLDSDDSDGDEVLPSQRKRELFSPVSGAAPGDAAASTVDSVSLPRVLAAELNAQTAALHFGSAEGAGRVVGLDLLPVRPVWGTAILRGDFTTDGVRRGLRSILPGGTASVVLSDMAHQFIGDSATDTSLQTDLAWTAAEFACGVLSERGPGARPGRAAVLRRGGHAVMKIRGVGDPGVAALIAAMEPVFRRCVVEKPAASRAASAETFLVCLSFRGRRIRRRKVR